MPDLKDVVTKIYEKEHSSEEKYDYFICTVAGGLFAYVGQNYAPHKLEDFSSILTPIALFFLTVCFGLGILAIRYSLKTTTKNKDFILELSKSEEMTEVLKNHFEAKNETKKEGIIYDKSSGKIVPLSEHIESRDRSAKNAKIYRQQGLSYYEIAKRYQFWRDLFLVFGFLTILLSKVIQPYIH